MLSLNKILIKNKKLFTGFLAITFLTISLIYGIVFMACGQFMPLVHLTDSLNDNYLYVMNRNDEFDNYLTDEMEKNKALYSYTCEEIDGTEIVILNMNEEGYKKGLPYFMDSQLFMFTLNNMSLEKEVIYTNNQKNVSGVILYADYFEEKRIKNVFLDFNVDAEYIRITDNITEGDYTIYENYNPEIENQWFFNYLGDDVYICTGKYQKKTIADTQKIKMELMILISVIPLGFSLISMGIYYKYYISSMKDELNIMRIYYMDEKKMKWILVTLLMFYYFLAGIIPLLIEYFIFIPGEISVLLLSVLIIFVMQFICVLINVNKEIKYIAKSNVWRSIDD